MKGKNRLALPVPETSFKTSPVLWGMRGGTASDEEERISSTTYQSKKVIDK